jgi:2-amino-4-hydroxy-6-hydroxymethyldihydropteridine diphosphokinase
MPPKQAFIGVGANLGDRWATIRRALAALAAEAGLATLEASAVYETEPVGVRDQPAFLNLVAGVETTLTPEELLAVLQRLEAAAGRRRDREVRWGPRTLDLDLLLFEGERRTGPDLILPHPRVWERAFVLVPLRELLFRAARFDRPAWTEARRLVAVTPDSAGVRRWTPPPV